MFHILQY